MERIIEAYLHEEAYETAESKLGMYKSHRRVGVRSAEQPQFLTLSSVCKNISELPVKSSHSSSLLYSGAVTTN
jgi:hypothetical protein